MNIFDEQFYCIVCHLKGCHLPQDLERARHRLNNLGSDPTLGRLECLDCPNYTELLQIAGPNEIQYVWQMSKSPSFDGDVEWLVLPTILGNILDRDYAKYVTAPESAKMKTMCSFGVHINFKAEVRTKWLLDRTTLGADGTRSFKKTCKTVVLGNFNRESMTLQVDGQAWRKIRCVRITHENQGPIVEGDLGAVLKERMQEYVCASDSENEEATEMVAELEAAAEGEGLLHMFEAEPLHDGQVENDVDVAEEMLYKICDCIRTMCHLSFLASCH